MAITQRNILVDVLAIAFGISSWVEISGLGVQMPLMVQTLPEGWKLGSYVVVVTQLANIGPILYGIARKFKSHKVLEIPTIHATLSVAFTSCLLLSFFWNKTSYIGGEEHSTAFLSLAFTLAMVDCTSSVLYLPFMANFRSIYVISCMIGEAACGLFPSLVGFMQGVGGATVCKNITIIDSEGHNVTELVESAPEPRFSIGIYFIILALMVLSSWGAFVLLNKWPRIQDEKVSQDEQFDVGVISHEDDTTKNEDTSCIEKSGTILDSYQTNFKMKYYVLLGIQTFICFFQNGILSSVQAFSCMPYSTLTYHLSVNLSLIANPVGCVIALFFPMWSLKSVIAITVFTSSWGVYLLTIALLSPNPPMLNAFGSFLVILSWVVSVGTGSYIKAIIAAIFRRTGGNRALFWGGAVSQIGSAAGGLFMFVIVNYTNSFQSKSAC